MRYAMLATILIALLASGVCSALVAQSPPPSNPAVLPTPASYPTKDGLGRPLPPQTFYCQYLGMARDGSGKYPLYENAMFTMATAVHVVQANWRDYVEETYHPSSPGNPMCAIVPEDPVQREGALKAANLLTQPATQVVIKTSWKP